MKKLLLTALIASFAIITEAASINWSVNINAWKLQDNSFPPAGTSVWLIDSANQKDIVSALKNSAVINFGSDTWEDSITALTGVYSIGSTTGTRGKVTEFTVSNAALLPYETYSKGYDLATLFIDNLSSDDTVYYNITSATLGSRPTNDLTALDKANFSNTMVADGTGWQIAQTESVPEPTSGLLMLIGMAGLALRRRRA